jgi:hypothetical protein
MQEAARFAVRGDLPPDPTPTMPEYHLIRENHPESENHLEPDNRLVAEDRVVL